MLLLLLLAIMSLGSGRSRWRARQFSGVNQENFSDDLQNKVKIGPKHRPELGQREQRPAPEGSSQRMGRAVDKWRPREGSTAEMLASVVSRTQPTTHEFCRHLESFFVHRRDIAGVYDANSVPVCSASPLRCVLCVCSRSALSLLSLCSHCALSQHYALCSVCAHTVLSLCPVCVLSLCSDCALSQHYALCSLCAHTVLSLCPVPCVCWLSLCSLTALCRCALPHHTLRNLTHCTRAN